MRQSKPLFSSPRFESECDHEFPTQSHRSSTQERSSSNSSKKNEQPMPKGDRAVRDAYHAMCDKY